LTLNIKKTRQFRENQRKAGRQLCMTFFRMCFIVVIVRVVNRFVDKTVVTAILVTCVVDQRCSSLSVSHKHMCYFTVLRHIFIFLTCKIIFEIVKHHMWNWRWKWSFEAFQPIGLQKGSSHEASSWASFEHKPPCWSKCVKQADLTSQ